VAEIISIDEKRLLSDKEKAARDRLRKIQAVRKVLQCTHCRMKCEKCGIYMEGGRGQNGGKAREPLRVPYRFCPSCSEEYIEYIERLKGTGDPSYYWHNEWWMKGWQAWIDYRSAIDQHSRSKEFLQLLRELEDSQT
jgi:hypothetical protein